jgi:hypothetical protein
MHASTLLSVLLTISTVCSAYSAKSEQRRLTDEPLPGFRETEITAMDCNAAFPKAPRSDCKALLEEMRRFPDNDDFCASLCFDQALNASHSFGSMDQKGACRVTMITNSITGNFTDDSHRCGAMYVNHFPYGPSLSARSLSGPSSINQVSVPVFTGY